jgi:hypothetical protein
LIHDEIQGQDWRSLSLLSPQQLIKGLTDDWKRLKRKAEREKECTTLWNMWGEDKRTDTKYPQREKKKRK